MPGRDGDTLVKIGLKNGDTLHIGNADAQLQNIVSAAKFKSHDEIKAEQEEKAKTAKTVDSSGKVIKTIEKPEEEEEGKDSKPTDARG
jgi:hypothetical protein